MGYSFWPDTGKSGPATQRPNPDIRTNTDILFEIKYPKFCYPMLRPIAKVLIDVRSTR